MGHFSMGHLLVVLVIVILLFGTKRLGSLGSDLGSAIRGFRTAMRGEDEPGSPPTTTQNPRDNDALTGESPPGKGKS